MVQFDLIHF